MNKYRNSKVAADGMRFDSKLEAKRYMELRLLEKAGKIRDLEIHPSFVIIPAFTKHGKKYRETRYIADFAYINTATGNYTIEDTKSPITTENAVYKLKKKLFEMKYPWTITEIKK